MCSGREGRNLALEPINFIKLRWLTKNIIDFGRASINDRAIAILIEVAPQRAASEKYLDAYLLPPGLLLAV